MPRKRIDQPVALFLEDGTVLQSEYMETSAEGIRLSAGGDMEKVVVLLPDQKIVHLQKLGEDRAIIRDTLVKERNRLALALLTIERWAEQFRKLNPEVTPLPELIIYGSGSLNLSVLSNETSHDLDVATRGEFLRWCEGQASREPIGGEFRTLEINFAISNLTFSHLGQWRARASRLRGAFGLEFIVMHPLDTISQKLLRISEREFMEKDLRHIRRIFEVLRPDSDTMASILLEGIARYTDPFPAMAVSSKRNTKVFLAEFFPDLSLSEIVRRYVRGTEENLRYIQQVEVPPMPEQDWEALLDIEEPWIR